MKVRNSLKSLRNRHRDNQLLIDPLVQTCVDICKVRQDKRPDRPTFCIIAQQLRQAECHRIPIIRTGQHRDSQGTMFRFRIGLRIHLDCHRNAGGVQRIGR